MFKPENELERVLVQAATDPALRPQFYTLLVQSAVFVPNYGPPVPVPDGRATIPAGTALSFRPVRNGDRELFPIFSSLPRLQHFVSQETPFLEMQAAELLRLTRGAEVVLNPGSDYGKEFTVPEIAQMLDGWNTIATRVTETETQVLLGQPANYPLALTETLARLFSRIKSVESAYLALIETPSSGEPPHLLIGVKDSGDWEKILSSAGIAAAGLDIPNSPVDFVRMTGAGSLEDYLRTTKPFYQRKLFGVF